MYLVELSAADKISKHKLVDTKAMLLYIRAFLMFVFLLF